MSSISVTPQRRAPTEEYRHTHVHTSFSHFIIIVIIIWIKGKQTRGKRDIINVVYRYLYSHMFLGWQ